LDDVLQRLRLHQLRSYQLDGKESQPGHLMLLTGAPGAGKSTALRLHNSKFPDVRDEDGIRKTVVFVEMPTASTKREVVNAIYKAMGHEAPKDWNASHIADEIAALARKHHVRLIILDEADRIFGAETEQISKFFVSLLNNVRVSIVLAGAPSILKLNMAYGLERRTGEDIVIEPYRWDDGDGQKQFRTFLQVFDFRLGYIDTPLFSTFDLAKRLYVASEGHLGIVSKLIVSAALRAQLENRKLDRKLLGDVWHGLQRKEVKTIDIDFNFDVWAEPSAAIPPIPTAGNPFLCKAADVAEIWSARISAEEKKAQAAKEKPVARKKRSSKVIA
jgi:type II secretory pathway predicted ATPase ExeA